LWKYRLVNPWLTWGAVLAFGVGSWLKSGAWILIGTLVTGFAFAWAGIAIRCPACKARIYWIGLQEQRLMGFGRWLVTLSECPACGAEGDGTPSSQRLRDAAPNEWKPGLTEPSSLGEWSALASGGAGFIAGTIGAIGVMLLGIVFSDLVAMSKRADKAFRDTLAVSGWVVAGMVAGYVTARLAPRRSRTRVVVVGVLVGVEMAAVSAGRLTPWLLVVGSFLGLLAAIGSAYLVAARTGRQSSPPRDPNLRGG
jgi:hypothetical protein